MTFARDCGSGRAGQSGPRWVSAAYVVVDLYVEVSPNVQDLVELGSPVHRLNEVLASCDLA